MIRPKVILEFGILEGLSTLNFAEAKDENCNLFSFDINPKAVDRGRQQINKFNKCHVECKNCIDYEPSWVKNLPVDLCFLDCSHILKINQKCLNKVLPSMSPKGLLAIHDTGIWTREAFKKVPAHYKKHPSGGSLKRIKSLNYENLELEVMPAERRTVEWLLREYPEYTAIHFHSTNFFRHGITLIQKADNLEKPARKNLML